MQTNIIQPPYPPAPEYIQARPPRIFGQLICSAICVQRNGMESTVPLPALVHFAPCTSFSFGMAMDLTYISNTNQNSKILLSQASDGSYQPNVLRIYYIQASEPRSLATAWGRPLVGVGGLLAFSSCIHVSSI
uniref:Uncharacterized protein n=1 Tax=Arundo donax TaxID=35708 RepID=A0A0A9EMD2_ARUDO